MRTLVRVGVAFSFGLSAAEVIELVGLADGLGFDIAYLADGDFDQFAILGACAGQTERIRLATGIASVYARTPTQLALASATIDALSGGRFTLGLGVGHRESAAVRDDVEPGRVLDFANGSRRLRETVDIVRKVLAASFDGESAGFDGEVFTVTGFATRFRPARRELPIHVGAQAPAAVEQAAGFADGVIASIMPLRALPEFTGAVEAGSAGRAGMERLAYVPTFVAGSVDAAREAVEMRLSGYIAARANYRRHLTRLGYEEAVAAVLENGPRPGLLPLDLLDSTTAYGSAEACAASLQRWPEHGVVPVLSQGKPTNGGSTYEQVRANLVGIAQALSLSREAS